MELCMSACACACACACGVCVCVCVSACSCVCSRVHEFVDTYIVVHVVRGRQVYIRTSTIEEGRINSLSSFKKWRQYHSCACSA